MPGPRRARSALLVAVLVLAAFNLRTVVTSVGALMQEIQSDIGLSDSLAGLLAALPVLTFAVVGAATPWLERRFGLSATLGGALAVMAVGLVVRPLLDGPVPFFVTSTLALVGGAVGNVALPTLVKAWFPTRIGVMTAVYTTTLAIGQTCAAGLSVPVAVRFGGWPVGTGIWAVAALLAALPWVFLRGPRRSAGAERAVTFAAMLRNSTAWVVALYFAAQSTQAFVVFGWFVRFFRDHGMAADAAGVLVAFYSLLFIPLSFVVPLVFTRSRRQRLLLAAPSLPCVVGYLGMAWFGAEGAWAWITLVGLGNAAFPLVLTLFGLRALTPAGTASLAAFAQGVGYLIAAVGPLAVGVLRGGSEEWAAALLFLVGLALAQAWFGWLAGRPRHVDAGSIPSRI